MEILKKNVNFEKIVILKKMGILKKGEFWKNVNFEKKNEGEFWNKMWILKKIVDFKKCRILKKPQIHFCASFS